MLTYTDDTYSFSGFITGIAVVFISGEMAGIGMLAAPWAVVNLGKSPIVIIVQFTTIRFMSIILLQLFRTIV